MEQEHREKMDPLPYNILQRLNGYQLLSLKMVWRYGWGLKFVRRPLNQKPTYVLFNDSTQRYAILDDDGGLKLGSGIKIRNESPA